MMAIWPLLCLAVLAAGLIWLAVVDLRTGYLPELQKSNPARRRGMPAVHGVGRGRSINMGSPEAMEICGAL